MRIDRRKSAEQRAEYAEKLKAEAAARESQAATPDEAREEGAIRRDFRRGNINFDFLQPEGGTDGVTPPPPPRVERRAGNREGKRGLFNRGRPPRPAGRLHVFGWTFAFLASAGGLGWIVFAASSVFWLVLAPFLLMTALWSAVMLALLKARPL